MITLTKKFETTIPVFAGCISPDVFSGKNKEEISELKLFHGNKEKKISELFNVSVLPGSDGKEDVKEITINGDVKIVRNIGEGMTSGRITINGNAGMHLGAKMSGGEIIVNGNADDWLGAGMHGGLIRVKGNAGSLIGSAYRGSNSGMDGGIIIIEGSAGNETGKYMKLGTIAVKGDSGDFTGTHMSGGTIVCYGKTGKRAGAEMRDGTIIAMHELDIMPTFRADGMFNLVFLKAFFTELKKYVEIPEGSIEGIYRKYSGDFSDKPSGEIFVFKGKQ